MELKLAEDYVQLKKIEAQKGAIILPHGKTEPVVRAEVLAVGPGEQVAGRRHEMPCAVGDTVLVSSGAGMKFTEEGTEYWFVHAGRKDILGVITG